MYCPMQPDMQSDIEVLCVELTLFQHNCQKKTGQKLKPMQKLHVLRWSLEESFHLRADAIVQFKRHQ